MDEARQTLCLGLFPTLHKTWQFFNFVLFIFQNKSSALINVHLDFEGNIGWEKLHIIQGTHQNRLTICYCHG